jgi:transposase
MYIRQTKTSNSSTRETYSTFRLVVSERVMNKVKQRTLLNLGKYFSLPKEKWPILCSRIEILLSGQQHFVPDSIATEIETLAQRYYQRLVTDQKPAAIINTEKSAKPATGTDFQDVDVNSLEFVRPRTVATEHVGLAALSLLGLPEILDSVGFSGIQRDCALASIVGRIACPGSELATWRWLQEKSAVGELLDVDFEGVPLMRLYRVSDLLIRHRDEIERQLFDRINTLFSLSETVTLYDLTNTYFEGEMYGNAKAKRGHSKEKRTDCPLVTLGLVLDGSGFIRRSRMFEGNVCEAKTLEEMLYMLKAPKGALVIMDRGIATEANVLWLIEHKYRYLVVSREKVRQFDAINAVETMTASDEIVKIQRVLSEDGKEVRLHCHSEQRENKEVAMTDRFVEQFEKGLKSIAEGLTKPRGEKKIEKLSEKIGRLKAKSHGIGQHYTVTLTPDESGTKALSLTWEKTPIEGSQLTHPGVYCLRTNEISWDGAKLWHTYTMLTDLESVFRCLKSELGLRPVFHYKENRADGHLFITVLAYQAVQVIRRILKEHGLNDRWSRLREILSVQQRVTATFKRRDGHVVHVRKTTIAEPKLQTIYAALRITSEPGGVKKLTA